MHASFGPIGQLGYAVHDVDPWVRNFLACGVGPFWVFRGGAADEFLYHGRPTSARFDGAISWSGGLMIEIIAPRDNQPSPYLDYLRRGREGLQHMCYFPTDYATARQQLLSEAYAQTVDGHTGGFSFSYFERPGGVGEAIELGRLSDALQAVHRELRTICAAWDGDEPVRTDMDMARFHGEKS